LKDIKQLLKERGKEFIVLMISEILPENLA